MQTTILYRENVSVRLGSHESIGGRTTALCDMTSVTVNLWTTLEASLVRELGDTHSSQLPSRESVGRISAL